MKLQQFTPEEIRTGFTDARLEYLCSSETYWNDRRNYGGRGEPYWTQEVYSIGRCLREISGWPSWLPIPVSTDHGVYFGPTETLEPHETSFPSKVHLTWSTWRLASRVSHQKKNIELITHPWVLYRRKVGYTKSPEASGTLIFVPHSTPGFDLPRYSLQPVIESIRREAHSEAPIVLIISMHDVNLGLHRKLRSLGLPIVTAGHTSSPYFVDRFYQILRLFEQGLSPTIGSQAFYAHEMGIPYRVVPAAPSTKETQKANPRSPAPSPVALSISAFQSPYDEPHKERDAIVRDGLGLEAIRNKSKILAFFSLSLAGYLLVRLRQHFTKTGD